MLLSWDWRAANWATYALWVQPNPGGFPGPRGGFEYRISHFLYCLGIRKVELDKHLRKESSQSLADRVRMADNLEIRFSIV
jgi:hypothetical protein